MITEEIKIPTDGRPIEAFTHYREGKPDKAFVILPGKGYTINHFLLDFLWRMAAEAGYFSLKAEYRGYTYRHLGESYDHQSAAEDARYVFDYLANQGFAPHNMVACGKSLGTIALASMAEKVQAGFAKAVLLTPVLYLQKGSPVFPGWSVFPKCTAESFLVFGSDDPYCDLDTARTYFPEALIDCYQDVDHGLILEGDYAGTIKIQQEIINKVKKFIEV